MAYKKITTILLTILLIGLFVCSSACARQGLPEFTELADKAGSAVVNIYTVKTVKGPDAQDFFQGMPKGGHPFGEFFDQFREFFGDRFSGPREQRSLGSGFIISDDGLIVTNNHVVKGADEINVKFRTEKEGEKSYPAEVIGTDSETDLALIKINADIELPVLEFGDSEDMQVGQWVLAIGNPFGLDHTVTAGIISAKGRVIGAGAYDNFLQTDASINPGNSGGPLLNMDGEVIGINTAIVASGQGIGFAIPSNLAEDVIQQLEKHKKVRRGWLGVSIQDVDESTARALGFDESTGALVASVQPGDPADKAGIKEGDIIVSVNGDPVEDASDLTRQIGQLTPGKEIHLTLWRNGKILEKDMELGERDIAQKAEKDQGPQGEKGSLGLVLRQLKPEEARAMDIPSDVGLVVTDVRAGSQAADAGVRPGDIILQANGRMVQDVQGFEEIYEKDAQKKEVLLLLIKREGKNMFLSIDLEEK
ncbi:MAG: DegQ family serine endoprotease [Desulfonatronovibrionaceae bacterium]